MKELVVTEQAVHDRLGLKLFKPLTIPGKARVNLRRFKLNQTTYLHRGDVVKLLRTESRQLGGDTVLDRLADLIVEVTT